MLNLAGIVPRRRLLRPPTATKGLEMDLRRVMFDVVSRLYGHAGRITETIMPIRDATPEQTGGASDELRREAAEMAAEAVLRLQMILDLRAHRFDETFIDRVRMTLGIDVRGIIGDLPAMHRDEMALAVQRNANLIRSLSDDAVKKVQNHIINGAMHGESHVDLRPKIQKDLRVSQARARLIARDQSQKFTSDLNRIRQKDIGVEKYIWSTSRDERVRQSHYVKEGVEFRWDEPPPDTGHPGEDVNCRCSAIAVID